MKKNIKKLIVIIFYCFATLNFAPTINAMEENPTDISICLELDTPDFSPIGKEKSKSILPLKHSKKDVADKLTDYKAETRTKKELKEYSCLEQTYEQLHNYSDHIKYITRTIYCNKEKQRKRIRIDKDDDEETLKDLLTAARTPTQATPPFHQIPAPRQIDNKRCGWFATYLGLIMYEYTTTSANLKRLTLKNNLKTWILELKSICRKNELFKKFTQTLNKYHLKITCTSNKIYGNDIKALLTLHFERLDLTVPENITILDRKTEVNSIERNIKEFKENSTPQLIIIYHNKQEHWTACVITTAGIWVADSYFQPIRTDSSISRNIQRVFNAFQYAPLQTAARLALELE